MNINQKATPDTLMTLESLHKQAEKATKRAFLAYLANKDDAALSAAYEKASRREARAYVACDTFNID